MTALFTFELANNRIHRPHALVSPLSIAALVTWVAIVLSAASDRANTGSWVGWVALVSVPIGFVLALRTLNPSRRLGFILAQALAVIAATLLLGSGMVPILLIVVASQLVAVVPPGVALVLMAMINAPVLAHWLATDSVRSALAGFLAFAGFQAFAGLTAHYAQQALRARDQLLESHAELAATSQLLAESARVNERLHLSRDLHDVAGHKLTALKLFLTQLLRKQGADADEELLLCKQLVTELLADIRAVVSELRVAETIDLRAAFAAAARVVDGELHLDAAADAWPTKLHTAQTLLRVVQEACTNIARHAGVSDVWLSLKRDENKVVLCVRDAGRGSRAALVHGNGIKGMQERLALLGGTLEVTLVAPFGVQVRAVFPLSEL